MTSLIRWLGKNFASFLLAFILAAVVWISAILSSDPNEIHQYPKPVELEIIGQDSGLVILDKIPTQINLTMKTPASIWRTLQTRPDLLHAWIDLSGLKEGRHSVEVKARIGLTPSQIITIEPAEIELTMEPLQVKILPVDLIIEGESALGYRLGFSSLNPQEVSVSGPQSLISQVESIRALIDIAGASETVRRNVPLQGLDKNNEVINGIVILPQTVTVYQVINLLGGYRNVVVKVVTTSQLSEGYWLTNITVTPPNVTVFSADPQLVENLPGYVETEKVDLTGLSDDVDIRLSLILPQGVELAGEESVLVRLSIAALEGSLPITLPIEIIGLPPEYKAEVSPNQVDILITGPLPLLNNLKPGGIRVSVNLAGLQPGTHRVEPIVDLLPGQLSVASIIPESVQVIITRTAFPGVTPTVFQTPESIP